MAAPPMTSSAAATSSCCARLPSAPLRAPRAAVSFPSRRTRPSSSQASSTRQSNSSCYLSCPFVFFTSCSTAGRANRARGAVAAPGCGRRCGAPEADGVAEQHGAAQVWGGELSVTWRETCCFDVA
jgi:hypothetical protein